MRFQPRVSLTPLDEVEPGFLKGTMFIEGVEHHFEMIEVAHDSQTGEQQVVAGRGTYEEWAINQQRYDDMQTACDGIYDTVPVNGRTFVCRLYPYCQ
jgi:hypothetical protein